MCLFFRSQHSHILIFQWNCHQYASKTIYAHLGKIHQGWKLGFTQNIQNPFIWHLKEIRGRGHSKFSASMDFADFTIVISSTSLKQRVGLFSEHTLQTIMHTCKMVLQDCIKFMWIHTCKVYIQLHNLTD